MPILGPMGAKTAMKKIMMTLILIGIGFIIKDRFFFKPPINESEVVPTQLEFTKVDELEVNESKMLIPQRLEDSISIPTEELEQRDKKAEYSGWDQSFQIAFAKCFQTEVLPSDFSNLLETLKPRLKNPVLELRNWHLNLKNGRTKRVMLLPREKENKYSSKDEASKNMIIREFSVDNEGLPVPEGEGLKFTPKKLSNILSQGSIYFSEEQTRYESSDKEGVLVVKQNGKLHSIEWYGKSQSFLCQKEASCLCSSPKFVAHTY